jgi:hypothetical protein
MVIKKKRDLVATEDLNFLNQEKGTLISIKNYIWNGCITSRSWSTISQTLPSFKAKEKDFWSLALRKSGKKDTN